MAKISLSFFTIKIFRLNEKKEPVYLKINNKNSHTDVNLLECIYGFLKSKSRSYDDDKVNEKIYKPTHIETNMYFIYEDYFLSSISSILLSGDYGYEELIVDPTKNTTVYKKKKGEAGVLPFGFSVYCTDEIGTALLVIQSFGAKGMSKKIKNILIDAIKTINNELQVKITSIVPEAYFKKLMDNQKINNIYIELYKKHKLKDSDEDINSNMLLDSSIKEVKYKRPLINKKNFYNIFINRNLSSIEKMIGISSEDETVSNIRMEFDINGSPKIVNYDTFYNLLVTEDITKEVEISSSSGHPVISSLFNKMFYFSIPYLELLSVIEKLDNNDIKHVSKKNQRIFYFDEGGKEIEKISGKSLSYSL